MAEQTQPAGVSIRPLSDVLREVEAAVNAIRASEDTTQLTIKDLRWRFDQVSAKMNQAIYNGEDAKIHDTTMSTVACLIEILTRS